MMCILVVWKPLKNGDKKFHYDKRNYSSHGNRMIRRSLIFSDRY